MWRFICQNVAGMSAATHQPTTMNLFPCEVSGKKAKAKEDGSKMTEPGVNRSVNGESQTAQMTIFYAGQVMVFDDFPADRAKEIMNFASGRSNSATQVAFAPSNVSKIQIESRSSFPHGPNLVANFGKILTQEGVQPSSARLACELPIARRVSLHWFLQKRKDRITANAPYQKNCSAAASSKSAESSSWLGLMAAQSPLVSSSRWKTEDELNN